MTYVNVTVHVCDAAGAAEILAAAGSSPRWFSEATALRAWWAQRHQARCVSCDRTVFADGKPPAWFGLVLAEDEVGVLAICRACGNIDINRARQTLTAHLEADSVVLMPTQVPKPDEKPS